MITNKRNIISRLFFCRNKKMSPYIKVNQINRKEETETLRLKGKMESFASLHPLQSEISQVFNFPKAPMDAKNLKRENET